MIAFSQTSKKAALHKGFVQKLSVQLPQGRSLYGADYSGQSRLICIWPETFNSARMWRPRTMGPRRIATATTISACMWFVDNETRSPLVVGLLQSQAERGEASRYVWDVTPHHAPRNCEERAVRICQWTLQQPWHHTPEDYQKGKGDQPTRTLRMNPAY